MYLSLTYRDWLLYIYIYSIVEPGIDTLHTYVPRVRLMHTYG